MAMQKSKRRELRKLREICRVLIDGKKCIHCKQPLLSKGWAHIGGADAAPFIDKLTWHHMDGDHGNNDRGNLRLVHQKCHKRFHMKQSWANGKFRRAA